MGGGRGGDCVACPCTICVLKGLTLFWKELMHLNCYPFQFYTLFHKIFLFWEATSVCLNNSNGFSFMHFK